MRWNEHYKLKDKHCLFSPSKISWLNYDDNKLLDIYRNEEAKKRGTRLHALAAELIELGIELPNTNETLNAYVNDAISFGMIPEQVLYFSQNFFGTADAIQFYNRDSLLRIHDLKTGQTPAHMEQLYIYSALFCLEYDVKPKDIDIYCRIYQFDDFTEEHVDVDILIPIIDKIVTFDQLIEYENHKEDNYVF